MDDVSNDPQANVWGTQGVEAQIASDEMIALRQLSHPDDWERWGIALDAIRDLPER